MPFGLILIAAICMTLAMVDLHVSRPRRPVGISGATKIRRYLTGISFPKIMMIWTVNYFAGALLFAILFHLSNCSIKDSTGACVDHFWDEAYFSFTTWSTVGYGDLTAQGYGRLLAVFEVFLSATTGTLLLSIVFVRALETPTPFVFPDCLVYDVGNQRFWFRFVNIDPENLREVSLNLYFLEFLSNEEEASSRSYDTKTSKVLLPFSHYPFRDSLNLTALHTVPDDGPGTANHLGDFKDLKLNPLHFRRQASDGPETPTLLDLEITGFFESTGRRFFVTKTYNIDQIVCGKYDNVNNYMIQKKSKKQLEIFISSKLNKIEETSTTYCIECKYFKKGCRLGTAERARLQPA